MRESKRRANKKYKQKYKDQIKLIRFELYPTDTDIKDHLEAKKAAGEATATYLKRLIREDMQREAREEASEQFQNYFDNIVSKQLQGDTCAEIQEKLKRGDTHQENNSD